MKSIILAGASIAFAAVLAVPIGVQVFKVVAAAFAALGGAQ